MRRDHFHQIDRYFGLRTFLFCWAASSKAVQWLRAKEFAATKAINRVFDVESLANFSGRLACSRGNKICCYLKSCFVPTCIIQRCSLEFERMSTCVGTRQERLMVDRVVVLTVVKLEEVVLFIVTGDMFFDSSSPVTSITISSLS